ncbi:MAG: hypothetical protein ACM3X9_13235 [Bacillota bacterium]
MTEKNREFEFPSKDWWKSIQKKPGSLWVMLGLIGLGLALLLSGNEKGNPSKVGPQPEAINEESTAALATRRQLESELAKTLETISGVGTVRVELNLKSSGRKIWERHSRTNKRVSQEQNSVNTEEDNSDELVIAKGVDGREAPVLKEELAPVIQGVIVVASGARDVRIKELLTNTVMTVLGLPAHRVMVIPGENYEEETK